MKKNWRNNIVVSVVLLSLLLFGVGACNRGNDHAEHPDTYTCPMHPTVVSDKPGTCPVCGMDLVRKARAGEEIKITEDLAQLIKSPNETFIASIKTIKGEFRSMPVSLEAEGLVTYDTRNIYTIPSKVGGRLEKVFLKYTFQSVRKGQKVAEIYSPELITAQRELLYLLENDPGNTGIIESSKNKLYLLGNTKNQVEELMRRKEVTSTFSIYSPYDGYVIREDQQPPTVTTNPSAASASSMGGGMAGSSSGGPATPSSSMNRSSSELIREGSYVSAGQTLFKVVNTSALRVELDLPVSKTGRLTIHDEVDVNLGNEKTIRGKVDFIQPFFTEGQEFAKVRLYVKNSSELQIGQLVRATIQLKPVEALWIPREAVLDLGLERIVFIKERGVFKPRKINTGTRTNGWVEVIQGISSSEEMASNAQYLVDSESFIKTK